MDGVTESLFWVRVALRHGLLTWAEGVAEFGERGFKNRTGAGQFVRRYRGIYRVAGSPRTERQELLALALALDAVASIRSTLALNGVGSFNLIKPEITRLGAGGFSREIDKRNVHVHWTNFLPDGHLTVIDGIPTTTLVRALCDASAVMSVDRLAGLVDECKRRKLVDYDELFACRDQLRARGRRKTTFLDRVLKDRVGGWVVGESKPEDKIRKWLTSDGYEPASQYWMVANGKRRRLDLALVDSRVAIEYLGLQEHATTGAVVQDSEKVTDVQLAGWFVVLVTKKTTRAELLSNVREAIRRQTGGVA